MHTRGFVALAEKYDSTLLRYISLAQCIAYAFIGLFVIMNIIFPGSPDISSGNLWNELIGICLASIIVTEVLLLYVAYTSHRTLGIIAVTMFFVPLWIIFLWSGWSIVLSCAASTYLFYTQSKA